MKILHYKTYQHSEVIFQMFQLVDCDEEITIFFLMCFTGVMLSLIFRTEIPVLTDVKLQYYEESDIIQKQSSNKALVTSIVK